MPKLHDAGMPVQLEVDVDGRAAFVLFQDGLELFDVGVGGAFDRVGYHHGLIAVHAGFEQRTGGIAQELDFLDAVFLAGVVVIVVVVFGVDGAGKLDERPFGLKRLLDGGIRLGENGHLGMSGKVFDLNEGHLVALLRGELLEACDKYASADSAAAQLAYLFQREQAEALHIAADICVSVPSDMLRQIITPA